LGEGFKGNRPAKKKKRQKRGKGRAGREKQNGAGQGGQKTQVDSRRKVKTNVSRKKKAVISYENKRKEGKTGVIQVLKKAGWISLVLLEWFTVGM